MRILFLTPRFPLPTTKGDKLRSWQIIRKLAVKHEVILLTYIGPEEERKLIPDVRRVCNVETIPFNAISRGLGLMKGLSTRIPYQVLLYESAEMKELVRKYLPGTDAVHLSTLRMAGNLPDQMEKHLVIDFIDALSINFERRAEKAGWASKGLFKNEHDRLLAYESSLLEKADLAIAVSPMDASALGANVEVVPISVDFVKYHPPPENSPRAGIVLTGNMSYTPNVEASEFMARQVMPSLLKSNPDAKLRLVGINPCSRIRSLKSEHVEVTGFVPSIADEIRRAHVAVAPMVSGSGLQIKILEAMACETPVVSTNLGNTGVGAVNEESILIGDSTEEIASHVSKLLTDDALAEKIGAGGHRFVQSRFSWDSTEELILKLYDRLQVGAE